MCQTLIKYHQTVTHTYKFDILAVMNVCGYLKKKYYARFWFVSIFAALCSSLGGRAKRWWWQQRSSSISDTWRWASFSKLMTFGLILGSLGSDVNKDFSHYFWSWLQGQGWYISWKSTWYCPSGWWHSCGTCRPSPCCRWDTRPSKIVAPVQKRLSWWWRWSKFW